MRQLEFIEPHRLEWRDAPDPTLISDDDALVRPVAVASCDLDKPLISGDVPIRGPFAFGHEGVGEVIEVGASVKNFRKGDLVSVPFQISCGVCRQCSRGRTAHCEKAPPLAMYGLGPLSGGDFGGMLADILRVPFADQMLLSLPDGIDPETVASLSDNIVDGWRLVGNQLAEEPGAEVLVVAGASLCTPRPSLWRLAQRVWTMSAATGIIMKLQNA